MCEPHPDRSLVGHLTDLTDQRCAIKRRHELSDMLVIGIAAALCSADGWVDIAEFGRSKEAWNF